MNCPHCDSDFVSTNVDEDVSGRVEWNTCPLCGWAQVVQDQAPPAELVQEAKEMLAHDYYAIIDKEGTRLVPWDITDEETAQKIAAQVGGSLLKWNIRENWDGTTFPVPFRARCLVCGQNVPIPEVDDSYQTGTEKCIRGKQCNQE